MGSLPGVIGVCAAGAGGAPAVNSRTPLGAPFRTSSGALAIPISTVGAAQNIVMFSFLIRSKMSGGSTRRKQTCVIPRAVLIQVKVQPFAWNMGSVQR